MMESINLNGISFRWNGNQLLITSRHGQEMLSGSDAAQLLDFLQAHQQGIYSAEQGQALPSWAHAPARYGTGQIVDQVPRLQEGKS